METTNLVNEVFIPITGYENEYEISNLGNVKSLPKLDGRAGRILSQEKIIRNHTTYKRVTLSKDGKVKRFQVHRLVAFHFIPNPENKGFVNHIDFNGSNNIVSNLEWVTQSENEKHSVNNNPIKQAVLKQRHAETAERMRIEQIKNLDNWVGVDIGYSIVQDYTIIDTKVHITMLCRCCDTTFKLNGGLSSLRGPLNKRVPMMCRSCAMKITRYNHTITTVLKWTDKIDLITNKYKSKKE